MKRGGDAELEGTQEIKVLEPWENPTGEMVFGPKSQDLMRGFEPQSREQTLGGVPIVGDAWIGPAVRDVKMHTGEEVGARGGCLTDGEWHRGRGCGTVPGYRLETRQVTFLGAPVGTEYRYTALPRAAAPAPTPAAAPRPRRQRVVRAAIPGVAPAVTVDEEVPESQDSVSGSPFAEIIGGGAGPQARARLARPEGASLADPKRDWTQSRTVDDRNEVGAAPSNLPGTAESMMVVLRPLSPKDRVITTIRWIRTMRPGREQIKRLIMLARQAGWSAPQGQAAAGWESIVFGPETSAGYWTDLNRWDDMLDTPNWHEIGSAIADCVGGGAGPMARARLARPESASLADPKRDWTQSRTVDDRGEVGYGTAPTAPQYGGATQYGAPSSTVAQYGTPPQPTMAPGGGTPRSLSSDTIDRINSLNTALQGMPDPSAVAPLILTGLAAGRYNGQRAFYHSKDYGEHWGKAMGVLWLASQMTGNEDVVRNMLNEARDRLNDARSKLRDITG